MKGNRRSNEFKNEVGEGRKDVVGRSVYARFLKFFNLCENYSLVLASIKFNIYICMCVIIFPSISIYAFYLFFYIICTPSLTS